MMKCLRCGAFLEDSARFCNSCGAPLFSPANPGAQAPPHSAGYFDTYRNPNGHNMGYPPPSAAIARRPSDHPTVSETIGNSLRRIGHRPLLLWGLSMLYLLLCTLSVVLSILPLFWIPLILLLSVGMTSIFLNAYRGKELESAQLFIGFKKSSHFLGGMAWMLLWIIIWALIPIAGIVCALIKVYSYRFVPYILLSEPDISPQDALKKSIAQTDGYKGRMFGADLLIIVCILGAYLVLFALSFIPYMRIIFQLLACLLSIFVFLFAPLVFGTIQASFYDTITNKSAVQTEIVEETMT